MRQFLRLKLKMLNLALSLNKCPERNLGVIFLSVGQGFTGTAVAFLRVELANGKFIYQV